MSDSDKPRPTSDRGPPWARADAGPPSGAGADPAEIGAVTLGSLNPQTPTASSGGWVAPAPPAPPPSPPPPAAQPEPAAPQAAAAPIRAAPEPPRAAAPRTGDLGPPPPQFSGSRRSGPPIGRGLAIGGALAVLLGVTAGLLFRPGLERDEPARPTSAPAEADAAAAQGDGSGVGAAVEPYRPPDRDAVRLAYGRAAQVFQTEGASGLARFGQQCFRSLERGATYRQLDFCLAFDAYAAAITQRAAGGQPPAPDSYFGQTEVRQTRVAEAVMAGQSDASARLLDIRRLAIEVARENGPAIRAAQPQAPQPAPASTPTSAPMIARAEAPPTPPAQPRPPAPAAARPAERRAEAAPRPRAPAPVAAPTAAEVAAARPSGRGPSFNCRNARSRSERLVCADPSLAALDRRLNAAFEDAIAAGVSRRELRAEQDAWLSVREAAAPDPDAVAAAYRRRIGELNAR